MSARSLFIWVTAGFFVCLPWSVPRANFAGLGTRILCLGVLAGVANSFGTWMLFRVLEQGAKASVAIPLTAMYPFVTVLFATVFLREQLSWTQWAGIGLAVLSGVLLSYEPEGKKAGIS